MAANLFGIALWRCDMANRNQLPSNLPPHDPGRSWLLVVIVVGIAAFSGISQIAITALAPADAWTRYEPLVETFKLAWMGSVGALLTLLGGKMPH